MDMNETIVCSLFKVKDVQFVSKRALVNALAMLTMKFEQLNMELFCVAPNHKQFEKLPAQQLAIMKIEAARRSGAAEVSKSQSKSN